MNSNCDGGDDHRWKRVVPRLLLALLVAYANKDYHL